MSKKLILLISVFILALIISIVFFITKKPVNVSTQTNISGQANISSQTNISGQAKVSDQTKNSNQTKIDATASTKPYNDIAKALNSIIVDPKNDTSSTISEEVRFDKIDFNNRLFRPNYNTKVELYVSSLPIKPSTIPTSTIVKSLPKIEAKTSSYEKSAFIDSSGNTQRWFSFNVDPSIKADKYIWQVSLVPFQGSGGDQVNPKALLSSGEIPASGRDFSIDFSKATSISKLIINKKISNPSLIKTLVLPTATLGTPPVQKSYYVRVIPVDNKGKIIGDGGTGIPVIYGKPYTKTSTALRTQILFNFDLQSTLSRGNPTFSGEFPNSFSYAKNRFLDSTNGSQFYCFLPVGFSTDTTNLVLQVSKAQLTSSDLEATPGLVFEKKLNIGDGEFEKLSKLNSIKVDFTLFAPPNSSLTDDETINYYVRVVALKPGKDVGTVEASYSKGVTVEYGRPKASNIKIYENKKIDAKLPQVLSYSYTPIKWESSDWMYRYVVIRQPLENEIFPGFGSNKPYGPYQVGTKLDFTPHPQDKSWWEEITDAISDFFGDLVGFVGDLTNWISSTYNNLKTGLVKFIAQNLPLVPDSLRDELQTALEGLVDYGLASIGIPPTLPNFDDLTNMGTDYLATVAMEAAGIPANDYLKDGLVDLSKGIASGMDSSTNSGSPNPMGWNFIKSDPDYMYKPAYVMVEIYNPYDVPTPEGYINGRNEFIIDSQKLPLSKAAEYLYAAFGGNVYYQTFKTISGQKIPALAPNQKLTIPIFLEELVGTSLWTNGPKVDRGDFKLMYFGLGEYNFDFNFCYQLPPVSEAVKSAGLAGDAIYSYTTTSTSIHFKIAPTKPYSK